MSNPRYRIFLKFKVRFTYTLASIMKKHNTAWGIWGLMLAGLLSGCSSLLYYPSRNLHYDPARLNLKPEEVFFPSKNGSKLFGWYFKSPKKSIGTVVFFHGNAENISSHYLNVVWMLEHGLDLFAFDYQGYGRSEGEPSPEKTVQDGIAALEWAHARNPDLPLVVFGQSLGGAIALRTVIESKNHLPIRYVAVDSTFPSYRSMARQVLSRNIFTWPFQWMGWLFMSDTFAPDGRIGEISPIPMLVIHGTQDQLVEFKMGERVFAEAREPKEFWRISGGGHTDIFSLQSPTYKTKFIENIRRALGSKL